MNSNEDNTSGISKTEHYLMINQHEAVDLGPYGNEDCEFKVIANKGNKILLTFNQPSQLSGQGRCASGTERGILDLEIGKDNSIIKSQLFITESCLLSLETIEEKQLDESSRTYIVGDLQSSSTYSVSVDYKNAAALKED